MLEHLRRSVPTLRFTLLVIVLLCWLLPTVTLGLYMGSRVFVSMQDKTEAALRTGAEYAQSMAVRNVDTVVSLARDAVYDNELNEAAQDYESGASPYDDYYLLVRGYLDRKFSREQSCTFALFFRAADVSKPIYTSQGYSTAVLFLQNAQKQALTLSETLDTHARVFSSGSDTYLVRNLLNTHMERYGILVIGLRLDSILEPILTNAAAWGPACAISLDDTHVGTFIGPEDATGLQQYGDMLCYTQTTAVGDSTLRYQVQADRHTVYSEMDAFRWLLVWMFILFVPICISIMFFVNRRISRPIAMLSDASDRIRSGELGVVVPMRGNDELGHLGVAFSEMSLRLKDLIEKSYKEEIALRDARIQALQSRINPHFINNALEAINWQARLNGDGNVSKMVETLSVLLNASLDRGEQRLVPLREELSIADAYFYFAGLQFGKKLTVYKNIDESLLEAPLPRLVVQTLIENAVEHGIAPAGGGKIELNVFRRERQLRIEVLNSGKRLDSEELARMCAMLDDREPSDGHLGIRNVNQRLQLIFGRQAGLLFDVEAHGDTLATLYLPIGATEQSQTTNHNPSQNGTGSDQLY
ncbi:MAG TPA: histidine kinase [Candidatus Limiplasma sp.]|nr:histidine kinase [Candidatus Limiplasma sp.]HPS81894.1 histidine kinase [Candidatus Limiplasma sp.]